MLQVKKVFRENPNNPLGPEVVRGAQERLIELKFNMPKINEVVNENLKCKYHPEVDSFLVLDPNDSNISLEFCCDEFRDIVKSKLMSS